MNFEFSEDQQFIRDQARKFLSQECPPAEVRKILEGEQPYHQDLWQGVAELGWTAMAIPEAYGGLGLGFLELCVIAEELGRVVAPLPFSSSVYLATEALKLAGDEALKQQWLPQLATGEVIGCLAAWEGAGRLQINASVADGQLSGTKLPVAHGDIADLAIVAALDESGSTGLYAVDLNSAGVTRSALNTMDPTASQARLDFEGVTAQRLSRGGGQDALPDLLDRAAVLYAFEQIGGAHAAMDMGMAYTKERYAFGRPVASFQAIKHKFADMYAALELARSNAYHGAWAVSSDAPDLPLAAATARVSASEAYYQASKENIQAHGGMGFTWEFDCHLYYRRAQYLSSVIGGQPHWKEQVAQRLLSAA